MKTNNLPLQGQRERKKSFFVVACLLLVALIIVFVSRFSEREHYEEDYAFSASGEEAFLDDFAPAHTAASTSDAVQPTKNRKELSSENVVADISLEATSPIPNAESEPLQPRREIKNAFLTMNSENIDESIVRLESLASKYNGALDQRDVSFLNNTRKVATIKVRIPSESFEDSLREIKSIARVTQESVTTQDVTQEFVDLQAQLRNKQAQEEQIREFFDRAEDVKDLLAIEQSLSRVRGEIEVLEGRLNYLESKTSFSFISLTITEELTTRHENSWKPGNAAKDAFGNLVLRFQEIINTGIYLFIEAIPLFILTIIGLTIAYAIAKRIYRIISRRIDRDR